LESMLVTKSLGFCGTGSISLLGGYLVYSLGFSLLCDREPFSGDLRRLLLEWLDRLELEGLRLSLLGLRLSGELDFLRLRWGLRLLLPDDGIK
jgi:hypothetical protein